MVVTNKPSTVTSTWFVAPYSNYKMQHIIYYKDDYAKGISTIHIAAVQLIMMDLVVHRFCISSKLPCMTFQ